MEIELLGLAARFARVSVESGKAYALVAPAIAATTIASIVVLNLFFMGFVP